MCFYPPPPFLSFFTFLNIFLVPLLLQSFPTAVLSYPTLKRRKKNSLGCLKMVASSSTVTHSLSPKEINDCRSKGFKFTMVRRFPKSSVYIRIQQLCTSQFFTLCSRSSSALISCCLPLPILSYTVSSLKPYLKLQIAAENNRSGVFCGAPGGRNYYRITKQREREREKQKNKSQPKSEK